MDLKWIVRRALLIGGPEETFGLPWLVHSHAERFALFMANKHRGRRRYRYWVVPVGGRLPALRIPTAAEIIDRPPL